jgi:hypothetical protein
VMIGHGSGRWEQETSEYQLYKPASSFGLGRELDLTRNRPNVRSKHLEKVDLLLTLQYQTQYRTVSSELAQSST